MRPTRPVLCLTLGSFGIAAAACTASPSGSSHVAPGIVATAPSDPPPQLAAIVEADLTRDMYALGGDNFRGREGGTLDEMRASGWLVDRMREAGLEPAGEDGTFFQWVPMRRYRQSDESRITIGGRAVRLFTEAAVLAPVDAAVDAAMIFVEPDAILDPAAVKGKVVATVVGPAATAPVAGVTNRDIPGRPRQVNGANAVRQAATKFLQAGAVAVIVASDSASATAFARAGDTMIRGRYGVDTANVTAYWPDATGGPRRPQSPAILWVRRSLLPLLRTPNQHVTAQLSTENFIYPSVNLVGKVRGTDARLRDEYVLYSGHQDHDGVRTAIDGDSIWNGADDNASGSVAILGVARAFAKQPGRRSVIFVWHGSEERGLIGSRYHVMHPMVPKNQIVAVLNGEMVGRNNPDSMTILGAIPPHRNSETLVNIARRANDDVSKFKLDTLWDLTTHPQGWYFRSDHLPYARVGIPAIEFSSNLHADYHTPRDEPSRIDFKKMTRVAKWMYATGWVVANADQRPPLDPNFKLER